MRLPLPSFIKRLFAVPWVPGNEYATPLIPEMLPRNVLLPEKDWVVVVRYPAVVADAGITESDPVFVSYASGAEDVIATILHAGSVGRQSGESVCDVGVVAYEMVAEKQIKNKNAPRVFL